LRYGAVVVVVLDCSQPLHTTMMEMMRFIRGSFSRC
jgi:hypothetical protein